MKKPLLLLFVTSLFSTAQAQASDTTARMKPTFIFSAEVGGSILGVGDIKIQDDRGSVQTGGKYQLNPTFMLRAVRVSQNGWGIGVRTEAARWHKSEDVYFGVPAIPVYTPGTIDFQFATPAFSLAPTVSKTLFWGRNELLAAVYVGGVYAPHKQESGMERDPQTLALISGFQRYPTSFGVQIGAEVQYRHWLSSNWAVGATAGIQRNFMRFSETLGGNFTGYRLNTVPVTIGASFRLK